MSAALTPMTVAGIMSGTSADGMDVALTRITPDPEDPQALALQLLAHAGFPFPPALRRDTRPRCGCMVANSSAPVARFHRLFYSRFTRRISFE